MAFCEVTVGIKIPVNMINEFYNSGQEFIDRKYKRSILFLHDQLKRMKESGKVMNDAEIFLLNLQNSVEKAEFVESHKTEEHIFGNMCVTFELTGEYKKKPDFGEYIKGIFYRKVKEDYTFEMTDIIPKIISQVDKSDKSKQEAIDKLIRNAEPLIETIEYIKDNLSFKVIEV